MMFGSKSLLSNLFLRAVAISSIYCGMIVNAAPPDWWSNGSPPVLNSTLASIPNKNHGLANIGQAKWMVSEALRALNAAAPQVASAVRGDLGGIIDLEIPNPKTAEWQEKQKVPLLLGQLKAIAAPFYRRIHDANPGWLANERTVNNMPDTGTFYPWTTTINDDSNFSPATIGQLKSVFSLRFNSLPGGGNGNDDNDGDGLTNSQELALGTNPNMSDTDGDGLPDGWEVQWKLSPLDPADGSADADGDNVTNYQEFLLGTNPYGYYTVREVPINSGDNVTSFADDGSFITTQIGGAVLVRPAESTSGPITLLSDDLTRFTTETGEYHEVHDHVEHINAGDGVVRSLITRSDQINWGESQEDHYFLIPDSVSAPTVRYALDDTVAILQDEEYLAPDDTLSPTPIVSSAGNFRIYQSQHDFFILDQYGNYSGTLPQSDNNWQGITNLGMAVGFSSTPVTEAGQTTYDIDLVFSWGSYPQSLRISSHAPTPELPSYIGIADNGDVCYAKSRHNPDGSSTLEHFLASTGYLTTTLVHQPGHAGEHIVSLSAKNDRMLGSGPESFEIKSGGTLATLSSASVYVPSGNSAPPSTTVSFGAGYPAEAQTSYPTHITSDGLISLQLPNSIVQLVPANDADHDGIPDDWERAYVEWLYKTGQISALPFGLDAGGATPGTIPLFSGVPWYSHLGADDDLAGSGIPMSMEYRAGARITGLGESDSAGDATTFTAWTKTTSSSIFGGYSGMTTAANSNLGFRDFSKNFATQVVTHTSPNHTVGGTNYSESRSLNLTSTSKRIFTEPLDSDMWTAETSNGWATYTLGVSDWATTKSVETVGTEDYSLITSDQDHAKNGDLLSETINSVKNTGEEGTTRTVKLVKGSPPSDTTKKYDPWEIYYPSGLGTLVPGGTATNQTISYGNGETFTIALSDPITYADLADKALSQANKIVPKTPWPRTPFRWSGPDVLERMGYKAGGTVWEIGDLLPSSSYEPDYAVANVHEIKMRVAAKKDAAQIVRVVKKYYSGGALSPELVDSEIKIVQPGKVLNFTERADPGTHDAVELSIKGTELKINSIDRFVTGDLDLEGLFDEDELGGLRAVETDYGVTSTEYLQEVNRLRAEIGLVIEADGVEYGSSSLRTNSQATDGSFVHDQGDLDYDSNDEDAPPIRWKEKDDPVTAGSTSAASTKQSVLFSAGYGLRLRFSTVLDTNQTIQIKLQKYNESPFPEISYTTTPNSHGCELINTLDDVFDEAPFNHNNQLVAGYVSKVQNEGEIDTPSLSGVQPTIPSLPPSSTQLITFASESDEAVQNRDLVARCMEAVFDGLVWPANLVGGKLSSTESEVLLKTVTGFATGFAMGLWSGLKSDAEALKQLFDAICSPVQTARALRSAFYKLSNMTWDQIKMSFDVLESQFVSDGAAELPWTYDGDNVADQIGLTAHLMGHISGFVAEQIVACYVGAKLFSAIGTTLKIVLSFNKVTAKAVELTAEAVTKIRATMTALTTAAAGVGADAVQSALMLGKKAGSAALKRCSQYCSSTQSLMHLTAEINSMASVSAKAITTYARRGLRVPFHHIQKSLDSWGKTFAEFDAAFDRTFKIDALKQMEKDVLFRSHITVLDRRLGSLSEALWAHDLAAGGEEAHLGLIMLYQKHLEMGLGKSGRVITDRAWALPVALNAINRQGVPLSEEAVKIYKQTLEKYYQRIQSGLAIHPLGLKIEGELHAVYPTMYRYAKKDTLKGGSYSLEVKVDGSIKMPDFNMAVDEKNGYWISPNKVDSGLEADDLFQLPMDAVGGRDSPRFRYGFSTGDVEADIYSPFGGSNYVDKIEPLNDNHPEWGKGGGTQFRTRKGGRLTSIYDLETNTLYEGADMNAFISSFNP